jgi:tryptophanyl-tRNA synthetase
MSSIGCVACKILLKDTLNAYLTPIREKIKEIQKESDFLEDLLNEGKKKATEAASSTLQEVKLKIIS